MFANTNTILLYSSNTRVLILGFLVFTRICLPIFGGVDKICSRWQTQVKNERGGGVGAKVWHFCWVLAGIYVVIVDSAVAEQCRSQKKTIPIKGDHLIRSPSLMSGFCSLITKALSLIVWCTWKSQKHFSRDDDDDDILHLLLWWSPLVMINRFFLWSNKNSSERCVLVGCGQN